MYSPLRREHHHDGEQQSHQRERADAGHELLLVPFPPLAPDQDEAGEHAGEEGDAQVDEDALRDLAHGDPRLRRPEAMPSQAGSKVMKNQA